MNILQKTLIAAACVFPMMATAADFPWMTFKMNDGTEISVASEGLSILYAEGNLLLKSPTVDQNIATNQLVSMKFTTTPAAVDGIDATMTNQADYFDLSGKKAGRFATADEPRKALPSGTYIMKSKEKTIKIIF